jgi:antitoxin CptB
MDTGVDARTLSRLKWRCRRGLLENDLFIERFFAAHETSITPQQARALESLMDLADNDLLDLFLRRSEPDPASHDPALHEVLQRIRAAPSQAPACSTRTRT